VFNAILTRLRALDPACRSGNFLSLQALKDLVEELVNVRRRGVPHRPRPGPPRDWVISLALVVHRLVERSVGGKGSLPGLAMARTVLVPSPARDGFAVSGS
jgi:hypothetical protein